MVGLDGIAFSSNEKSPTDHPARLVLHYPDIQLSVVPFILPTYGNSPGTLKMSQSEA